MRPLFESFRGPLLKLGVEPLVRYSNHQEIIGRRLEQIYTSYDTRLEWLREMPNVSPNVCSMSSNAQSANFFCSLSYFGEWCSIKC